MKAPRVSEATVTRISMYSRYLEKIDRNGIISVSSGEIADGVGVSPAQVRQDLAYFGEFGTRGVGYNVQDLMRYTLKILGLDREWNVIIIGAGNLGCALCAYKGFNERGYKIVGVFDNDLTKIGKKVGFLEVLSMERMGSLIKEKDVKIGIIATPEYSAQEVADYMVGNGIKSILNFAPRPLTLPENIDVRNVDLSVTLEILTFHMSTMQNRE